MKFEEVILEQSHVRLEPLSLKHRAGLCDAISDGELWNIFFTIVPHPKDIDSFMENALNLYNAGDGITFAIIDKRTDKVAGSTRFMKANLLYKRVEIGFTFLGKSWQKTRINTEAKLLMLSYAFEVMKLNRVELITDYLNNTSRNAILRLGAKEEGILRSHMVMGNGRIRDSVLYSVVSHEWAGIKQNLEFKLSN